MSIIDQSNREALVVDSWTFGGGTALMLQIEHRESHDIDLFIDDPQILPLLNPETQDFKPPHRAQQLPLRRHEDAQDRV
ncbi:MAG: nucleotidyl transferase AbiEii/AbiGii toxin family protein [Hyphomicrobiales bacterium]|nr:nucleotidyl transferase AbiEii/AbiGii toxin family protein [Hyphomicrobiales bacterium]